ncbi:hypothetical protein SARC_00444 [Sphaeroforma arctica JP610]|uniref:Uncharacterized protein n=1 Tax=Sphaeroforma arctica JP610 TaxID=667725 RepID=A0A0L0GEL0_9EUKA|nr:hypothetical protein SARC_00444 [Sphaeroforma arctica JP610]KNC87462.1 hypothetical protein SARC_00444 [Sphaeroforma arctica JP610]|eukprot:XP_014161364.1 hypothetical protein SARC_00444 [Sphaeroforma arctica JP610]
MAGREPTDAKPREESGDDGEGELMQPADMGLELVVEESPVIVDADRSQVSADSVEPCILGSSLSGPGETTLGGHVSQGLVDSVPPEGTLVCSGPGSAVDSGLGAVQSGQHDTTARTGPALRGNLLRDDSCWYKGSSHTEANMEPVVEGIPWLLSEEAVSPACGDVAVEDSMSQGRGLGTDSSGMVPEEGSDGLGDPLGVSKERLSDQCWQQRMAQREAEELVPGGMDDGVEVPEAFVDAQEWSEQLLMALQQFQLFQQRHDEPVADASMDSKDVERLSHTGLRVEDDRPAVSVLFKRVEVPRPKRPPLRLLPGVLDELVKLRPGSVGFEYSHAPC